MPAGREHYNTAVEVSGLNPDEVTKADNYFKATGSPLFILVKQTTICNLYSIN
tara:strand:+ start:12140 stop:12298 length:159 start_codon:yes stop_codon:yes gene_type:complete